MSPMQILVTFETLSWRRGANSLLSLFLSQEITLRRSKQVLQILTFPGILLFFGQKNHPAEVRSGSFLRFLWQRCREYWHEFGEFSECSTSRVWVIISQTKDQSNWSGDTFSIEAPQNLLRAKRIF